MQEIPANQMGPNFREGRATHAAPAGPNLQKELDYLRSAGRWPTNAAAQVYTVGWPNPNLGEAPANAQQPEDANVPQPDIRRP